MILCTFLISIKSLNPNIFNGFQAFSFLQVSKTGFYHILIGLTTRKIIEAHFQT
jgi:hypothetical protein